MLLLSDAFSVGSSDRANSAVIRGNSSDGASVLLLGMPTCATEAGVIFSGLETTGNVSSNAEVP